MTLHIPQAKLRSCVNTDTGNVFGVVSHVCNRVNSLVMPAGFYDKKRASNAVGIFYERYVAYILGGSKTFNPNAQSPDVQLPHPDSLEQSLLFEVKAWHRTNGIVLKRRQLELFSRFNNCLYAVVFHKVPDIQKRWEESRNMKKTIRQELAEPSSIFIVPAQLMLDFYAKNAHREQPMPHYKEADETYVSMKESHMQKAFYEYETDSDKVMGRSMHIISNDLTIDDSRMEYPFIIRI